MGMNTIKNRRTLAWMPCPVCKGAAETTPDTLLVTHTRA